MKIVSQEDRHLVGWGPRWSLGQPEANDVSLPERDGRHYQDADPHVVHGLLEYESLGSVAGVVKAD